MWFVGDPTDDTHYELMIGQGFNTQGLTPFETGNNFAVGGSGWWDVVGDYGAAGQVTLKFTKILRSASERRGSRRSRERQAASRWRRIFCG